MRTLKKKRSKDYFFIDDQSHRGKNFKQEVFLFNCTETHPWRSIMAKKKKAAKKTTKKAAAKKTRKKASKK
jgi:hypothetical protein